MKTFMHPKFVLAGAAPLVAALSATLAFAADPQTVEVYKSPTCGCCTEWVTHMKKNGFNVSVHEVNNVAPFRRQLGIPDQMESCHSALVGGYAIEGHVPAADVKRLLRERPKAKGIAVPGMVQGSPGMEQGPAKDPYQVLLFDAGGKFTVFARH